MGTAKIKLMLGGNPAMDFHPIHRGEGYSTWPYATETGITDGPPGSNADLTFYLYMETFWLVSQNMLICSCLFFSANYRSQWLAENYFSQSESMLSINLVIYLISALNDVSSSQAEAFLKRLLQIQGVRPSVPSVPYIMWLLPLAHAP